MLESIGSQVPEEDTNDVLRGSCDIHNKTLSREYQWGMNWIVYVYLAKG
jgi:hypothetical protein